MEQFIHEMFSTTGGMIVSVLVSGLAVALGMALAGILGWVASHAIEYLKVIIDSTTSGKVRERCLDAVTKLHASVGDLISSEQKLYEEEMHKIVADGKIEQQELKDLVKKLTDLAVSRMSPDVNTFKRFICGDDVRGYVESFVTTRVIDFVNVQIAKKLGNKALPFPQSRQ